MLLDSFKLNGKDQKAALTVAETVVREELSARIQRGEDFQRNHELYNGEHAKHFRRKLDESDELFKYRKDNAVVDNLCAFTVNLSSKYLYGKASKVVRQFSKDQDTNQSLIDLTYDKVHIDSFFLEAATQTSIYGEQLVRLIPVDAETKLQVTELSQPNTYPHPILLDPRFTFCKVNLYGKLEAVVMFYDAIDYTTGISTCVMELIVDDSRWTWKSASSWSYNFGNTLKLGMQNIPFFKAGTQSATTVTTEENPFILSQEFVLFVNNDARKSDVIDIAELNISLDEALTDKRHFFQRHGWPQMVTSVDLRNVEKSPNKIWEVATDFADDQKVMDKFGFLTWDGKQDTQQVYVENLERMIMILSNTAAISTGDLKAIGQLRSGAALITAHSVAIHKTEAKQIVWERNEKDFYRALVNYDSYLHGTKPDVRYKEFKVYIRFPKDFVPGAELDRVSIQNMQFSGHLKPLKDILLEDYGNLTEKELNEKRDEIIADSTEVIDSARLFESMQTDSGGTQKALRSPMVKSKEQTATKQ